MYNKKAIQDALAKLNSAKKPKQEPDIIVDPKGQWAHPGVPTRIPSNNITMQGVPYPVLGVDDLGNEQMMLPGGEYTFPGNYVDEFPMAKYGGLTTGLTNTSGNLLMNNKGKRIMAQSGSLSATNELFLGNPLVTRRRRAVYVPGKPFQKGGTPATDVDSLALRNNSIAVQNYYKNKNYKKADDNSDLKGWEWNYINNTLNQARSRFNENVPKNKITNKPIPFEEYYKKIDNNKFYQRELANTVLDTRVPMQMFDKRIVPTSNQLFYSTANANDPYAMDQVNIYTYDPLSVTPWNMLNESEKEERLRRFGTSGTPYDIENVFPTGEDNYQEYDKPHIDYVKKVEPIKREPNLNTDLAAWLKTQNAPTSYAERKKLYQQATGKDDYKGSAEQNIGLLNLLKEKGLDYTYQPQQEESVTEPVVNQSEPVITVPDEVMQEPALKEQPRGLTQQTTKSFYEQLPDGTYVKRTRTNPGVVQERLLFQEGGPYFDNPFDDNPPVQKFNPYYDYERIGINPDHKLYGKNITVRALPDALADEQQYELLKRHRLKDMFSKKEPEVRYVFQEGGSIELELTPEEIEQYRKGGFVVEELPKAQEGIEQNIENDESLIEQDLKEQIIYATPESRKKYEDVYAKAQAIVKTFPRAAEYFTKNKRYKDQGIEGLNEYINDITEFQKNAEAYYKARQGVKKGRISTEDFERAYRERGWQQFDSKNVKTSEEDQKELEETWYGPTDEQGRRRWMGDPRNVAKVAQGVALAAPLAPFAPAVLANPLVQAGLTAYGVYDATTNTLPEAYRDFSEGRYLEGLGNVGMAALDLAPIPLFGTNLLSEVSQAGKYLTQGPLKNAYKLNPRALKETPEVVMYRTQKPGQTEELMELRKLQQKRDVEGLSSLSTREKIKLSQLESRPGFGQGFDTEIDRIGYYGNPNVRSTRGYQETPEILRVQVPREQAAGYNISNFPEYRKISTSPRTEHLLPDELIQSAERFSFDDYARLMQEDKAFNTPHWWRGYGSNTPKQLSGSSNVEGVFKGVRAQNAVNSRTTTYTPEEAKAMENASKSGFTWAFNPMSYMGANLPKEQWWRKVGSRKGMESMIQHKGHVSPDGVGKDHLFFSKGNKPNENYRGIYATSVDPKKTEAVTGWNRFHGPRGQHQGYSPTKDGRSIANVPISDPGVEVWRRLPFSNSYTKVDKQKILNGDYSPIMKAADVTQDVAEKMVKWAIYGSAAQGIGNYLFGDDPSWEDPNNPGFTTKTFYRDAKPINYTPFGEPILPWWRVISTAFKNEENILEDKHQQGGIVVDLTPDEIKKYQEAGYVVEEI